MLACLVSLETKSKFFIRLLLRKQVCLVVSVTVPGTAILFLVTNPTTTVASVSSVFVGTLFQRITEPGGMVDSHRSGADNVLKMRRFDRSLARLVGKSDQ